LLAVSLETLPSELTRASSMSGPFFAHSGVQQDHSDWQLLADHLAKVASLAEGFMRDAVPASSQYVAMAAASGWLHDLGKYRPQFQNMIRGLPTARTETWHKQAGAARSVDAKNPVLAFAIAGHHGGLPAMTRLKEMANGPSGRSVAEDVWPTAVSECPALKNLDLQAASEPDRLSGELMTRAVFSCLVDADWTDTANHARQIYGLPPEQPAPALQAEEWLQRVLKFIAQKADACREAFVAEARADVLRCALQRADDPPGFMSLTVPTGGGKTLSGLAFALRHAARHGLRRIIYVAPYLSILEQNAGVIRAALGFDRNCPEVFEHHSLSEPFESEATASDSSVDASKSNSTDRASDSDNETRPFSASRRAENWDAPIVITTSVQFFESLFANRPGSCRKLHNIARSVILLDECQTLPPGLVAPTCGMLGQLVERLGCSVVLCTATQPALQHPAMPERLKQVVEIAPPDLKLFERLRRVEVSWPHQNDASLSWPEVAQRMASERASLCIVNTRRAARELAPRGLHPRRDALLLHLCRRREPRQHQVCGKDRF
jgi:CRISPR-associated endonuclease/helicase Cas3